MKEQRERSAGGSGVWLHLAFVLVVLVLPVLYVLSIGPVVAVADATSRDDSIVQIIYSPVIWLHDHTFLKTPLEKYASLWGWN